MTHPQPPGGAPPVVDRYPHCWRCNRLLAEFLTRPWQIRCRCKARNPRPIDNRTGALQRDNAGSG